MKLSPPQLSRFWREWTTACRVAGWTASNGYTATQINELRHELLERAGFSSLTQVDKTKGFDKVLAELTAIGQPDNLQAQLDLQAQPRKRLIFALDKLTQSVTESYDGTAPLGSTYLAAIMRDRFGHTDLDSLSLGQLEQLRFTLADRLVEAHNPKTLARRNAQARRRRATAEPPARISLPAPEPAQAASSAEELPDYQDTISPVLAAMTTGEEDTNPY
jgi:hypothetical protein